MVQTLVSPREIGQPRKTGRPPLPVEERMMSVSLSTTPVQLGKLRAVAIARGVSMSQLLRQAIELVLAEEAL
jgi:hypothetical protein